MKKGLPLLWEGLRRRSPLLIDCGLDLLCPPLAELAALLVAWAILVGTGAYFHLLPLASFWAAGVGIAAVGLGVYILGGLRLSGAGVDVYLALLRAPFYAAWKIALYAMRPFDRKTKNSAEWVRTERAPIAAPSEPKTP